MNLNYIHLGLDYYDYIKSDNRIRFDFQKHTNFIDDYFSKAIRKLKFKTDGSFNMLAVSPTEFEQKEPHIVPANALDINVGFDRKRYKKIKGSDDVSYYIELLEIGFKLASKSKEIPLESLLDIIDQFKKDGCKNEWVHKKKRFKEEDIEIQLICEFTTNYFQLRMIAAQISSKKELINGVILKTEAGVSIHERLYKDILIEDDIIVTDKSDSPRIIIDKKKALEGVLEFKFIGDKEMTKIMSYKL